MATIDTVIIGAADPAAAESFYSAAFGPDLPVRVQASQEPTTGFRAFHLSLIAAQPADVQAVFDGAVAAGATTVKPVQKSMWGVGGVLQAPDGTLWKVVTPTKKDTGRATTHVDQVVLLLGVEDVGASKRFYVDHGLTVAKSFGKYVEFEAGTGAVTFGLLTRRALAKDAGVPPEGTGSHRLTIVGDVGAFTDPDGFAWEGSGSSRDSPRGCSLQFRPPPSDGHRVHPPLDDLPRSPSGRIPQWVIDDTAVLDLHPPTPPRRRRPARAVVALAVLVAGAWWWASGAPALPDAVVSSVTGLVGPAPEPPSAEVVGLADAAHLSDAGRALLYGARTEILGADDFAGRCDGSWVSPSVRADGAVGCYIAGPRDSIVAYAPVDPRLHLYVVETVAHETLHAAWDRIDDAEQARMATLLTAVVDSLPADDTIHEQIAGSVGRHPENRPTELFAYVGTQVPPGLDPELEAVYARFVADREALVAVHTGWVTMLDEMRAAITTASDALVAQEQANAVERGTVDGNVASLGYYRQEYEAKVAEVASMSGSQRQRLRLSWEWWDGTVLPMAPADETLATAAALLARDEADLPARSAAVAAAEAAVATERLRVEAMIADLTALQRDLDPASATASAHP